MTLDLRRAAGAVRVAGSDDQGPGARSGGGRCWPATLRCQACRTNLIDARRGAAAGLAPVHRATSRPSPRTELARPFRPRRPVSARCRRLLPALQRKRLDRARLAAEPYAGHRPRGRMAGDRRRADPARRPAGAGGARPLRARAAGGRGAICRPRWSRPTPNGCGRWSVLEPRVGQFPAFPRLRDRPRPRRLVVRARRPHPGALGRGLRAGKPHRHLAGLLRVPDRRPMSTGSRRSSALSAMR